MKKRLITCSDGTWDKPETDSKGDTVDSNVCIMYNAISKVDAKGTVQMKVYDTGVGTGYSFKDKFAGGIIGFGIDQKIKDIYTFLMLNYEQGDEIYLFGFSRGAYTARSLAGFIRCCGILKHEHINLVDKAYELYRDRNDYTSPTSDLMVSFRKNYCVEDVTKIKFIGVWDTVASLGLPLPLFSKYNSERYKFHDATLSSTVEYAFHALAVDEHRKMFKPTLWEKSNNNAVKEEGFEQKMEQRWFPGVHCNIGGGYRQDGLSNGALQWLVKNAVLAGLAFVPEKLEPFKPNWADQMANSYVLPYNLWPPISREISLDPLYNAYIDESVWRRKKDSTAKYNPKNVTLSEDKYNEMINQRDKKI